MMQMNRKVRFNEEALQLQLYEIRKNKRRDSLPFAALTAKNANSYFNAKAKKQLNAEYVKWFRKEQRIFVAPAVKTDENAYHIRGYGNVFIPELAREVIGNGVYCLVQRDDVFELVKIGKNKQIVLEQKGRRECI